MSHKRERVIIGSLAVICLAGVIRICTTHAQDRVPAVEGDTCLNQPDLTVPYLVVSPTTQSIGENVQLSDSVSNGCANTYASTTTKIYIGTNTNSLSCLWTTHLAPGLAKGKTSWWSNTISVPTCAVAGVTNYISIVADGGGSLAEFRENNNTSSIPIFINP